MKRVLIVGTVEGDKDAIIDTVVNTSRNVLPDFRYLKFHDMLTQKDIKGFASDMGKASGIKAKIEKSVYEAVEGNPGNIVVNGFFSLKTGGGFFPIIDSKVFSLIKPDAIILMESDLSVMRIDDSLIPTNKEIDSIEKLRALNMKQSLNRIYAVSHSLAHGSSVKMVMIDKDDVKSVIKKTRDALSFALK